MRIVINNCFGGFGLSEAGVRAYWGRKGKEVYRVGESGLFASYFDAPLPPQFQLPRGEHFMKHDHPEYENYNKWYGEHSLYDRNIPRNDSDLIEVVEELGDRANGQCANLEIVEIPDDVEWEISEYDGNEHIAEKHRTWG